jgi:hypothetical protein
MKHIGTIVALQSITYIIKVRWWQHHQTKLPMARISANLCSLFLQIYNGTRI